MTDDSKGRSGSGGFRLLRRMSALFFGAALVGIGAMIVSDGARHWQFSSLHTRIAAYPLMLIGLSYLCLMLSARRMRGEMVKGVLLGLAFVMWGGEQLLPTSAIVTVMDGAVVTIFVVDLGLMIVEPLKRRDHDLP